MINGMFGFWLACVGVYLLPTLVGESDQKSRYEFGCECSEMLKQKKTNSAPVGPTRARVSGTS